MGQSPIYYSLYPFKSGQRAAPKTSVIETGDSVNQDTMITKSKMFYFVSY